MASNEPRKSLTERVADRKAGIEQAPDHTPRQKVVSRRLEMFGTILAMFGLFMLAYTVYKSAGDNSWANDRMVMYCIIFVVGRALKAASDALSRLF
jgi:hypothetical protein